MVRPPEAAQRPHAYCHAHVHECMLPQVLLAATRIVLQTVLFMSDTRAVCSYMEPENKATAGYVRLLYPTWAVISSCIFKFCSFCTGDGRAA